VRVALAIAAVLALTGAAGASTSGSDVALVFAQQLSAAERTNTTPNRYVCAATPNGLTQRKVTPVEGRAVDPDVAPLGAEIAYVSALVAPFGALERVSAGGGAPVRPWGDLVSAWPTWSADGQRIFVSSTGTTAAGGDLDLFAVMRNGESSIRVVIGPQNETMPSAGGGSIAFVRSDPAERADARGELWSVREDGVGLRRLLTGAVAKDPDLSADARRIVFDSPDGIRVLTVEPVFSLSPPLARGSDPEFSPDGTRIAFVRDGDIWTMTTEGGDEVNVTHSPIIETDPTWQAAGTPAGGAEPCAIVGTEGDDVLVGSPYADWVYDLGGNDVVRTLEGDDLVFDGAGADHYELGDGADAIIPVGGGNTIDAGPGDDRISGSDEADRILGGDGNDTVWGRGGADVIFGGPGNDRIEGNGGDDSLDGGLGDDVLYGGLAAVAGYDGYDLLLGRGGNDRLAGGWQADRLFGGAGHDRLRGGPHGDYLNGEAGIDDYDGQAGDDLLLARDRARERVFGGPGFDRARLDAGDRRGGVERVLR
jgi:Ca2+-binding RTX toxin-like protein